MSDWDKGKVLITNYPCPKCLGKKKEDSICDLCDDQGQLPKVKSFDNEVKVKTDAKFVGWC